LLAAAALVTVLYALALATPELADLSGDSARYLLLARGLAEGRGYVNMETPGRPPHTEFAPGVPALLAVMMKVTASPWAGKVLMYLFLLGSVGALYWLARERDRRLKTGATCAAGLALLWAAMPQGARMANVVMSDLPYTAVSVAALAAVDAALRAPRPRAWVLAGLAIAAAFYFRQVAVALWLGSVAGIALQREMGRGARLRAALLLTAGFALPAGLWLVRNHVAAGSVDQAHYEKLFAAAESNPFAGSIGVAGLLKRTGQGLAAYVRFIPGVVLDLAAARAGQWLRLAVAVLAAAPVIYGLILGLGRRRGPLEFYFIFYFMIICVWQSHYPRYLVPAVPLGLLLAAEAIRDLPGLSRIRMQAALLAAAVALSWAVAGIDLALMHRGPKASDAEAAALTGPMDWGRWYQLPDLMASSDPAAMAAGYQRQLAACIWMRDGLPSDAVVMARKPALAAYYSGHYAIQYPAEADPARFWERCREMGATHFLLDETSPAVRALFRNHLDYLLQQPGPPAVTTAFELGGTLVLAYHPAANP
jgi:hypothetical protein